MPASTANAYLQVRSWWEDSHTTFLPDAVSAPLATAAVVFVGMPSRPFPGKSIHKDTHEAPASASHPIARVDVNPLFRVEHVQIGVKCDSLRESSAMWLLLAGCARPRAARSCLLRRTLITGNSDAQPPTRRAEGLSMRNTTEHKHSIQKKLQGVGAATEMPSGVLQEVVRVTLQFGRRRRERSRVAANGDVDIGLGRCIEAVEVTD